MQLEANRGRLPDRTPLVSAENLLMRRQPGVALGHEHYYGMGLENMRDGQHTYLFVTP